MTPEEKKLVNESFQTMDLESKDLVKERVEQIKALFPEIAVEGDGTIDFEKLRLILGDEVDEGQERYAFMWPGKADAIKQAQTPSTATLRPDKDDSVDWDTTENIYIEGDNLEVLKLLQRGYHGKVKMIYIDPPYNTGHDFVYKDNFGDTIENYKEQAGLSGQSNADTSGRYHSDWLSMMYPRLRVARELLDDDGVIFISIDDNEVRNLRYLCDEVFGESCFVASIAWQKAYAPKNNSTGIPAEVETVMAYSKYPNWTPKRLPRTKEMNDRYKSPDGDPIPWKSGDSSAPGAITHQGMVYAIQHPITGNLMYPPMSCCWRAAQDDLLSIMNKWAPYHLEDLHDEDQRAEICGISPNEVRKGVKSIMLDLPLAESAALARKRYEEGNWPLFYFTSNGEGRIAKKVHLDESLGRIPTNYWPHDEVGHSDSAKKEIKALFNGDIPFDTPKPVDLMKRILQISTEKEDLVLDFFSGSATLADAVMQVNAENNSSIKYILVQIPEPLSGKYRTLAEIGEERIRRAGKRTIANIEELNRQPKLEEEAKQIPDIGFRVLKLDSSNFDEVPEGALYDNIVKPGRSEEDIIFEMMLKWGLDLSLPMENIEIEGYPATSIAANELICCMNDGLTVPVLEAIAKLEPKRVFFLDSVLTDTLKLNAAQIFKRVGDKLGYEIELRTV